MFGQDSSVGLPHRPGPATGSISVDNIQPFVSDNATRAFEDAQGVESVVQCFQLFPRTRRIDEFSSAGEPSCFSRWHALGYRLFVSFQNGSPAQGLPPLAVPASGKCRFHNHTPGKTGSVRIAWPLVPTATRYVAPRLEFPGCNYRHSPIPGNALG
jgi:hypothetical protein